MKRILAWPFELMALALFSVAMAFVALFALLTGRFDNRL